MCSRCVDRTVSEPKPECGLGALSAYGTCCVSALCFWPSLGFGMHASAASLNLNTVIMTFTELTRLSDWDSRALESWKPTPIFLRHPPLVRPRPHPGRAVCLFHAQGGSSMRRHYLSLVPQFLPSTCAFVFLSVYERARCVCVCVRACVCALGTLSRAEEVCSIACKHLWHVPFVALRSRPPWFQLLPLHHSRPPNRPPSWLPVPIAASNPPLL